MRRQQPTPPGRFRPDLLDDEPHGPETPRLPPDQGDAAAALAMGKAALAHFFELHGAEYGIGVIASWDDRIHRADDRLDAIERWNAAHDQRDEEREQRARERHFEVLEILAKHSSAIGSQGATLAAERMERARASLNDRRELAPPEGVTRDVVAPSTWPAAIGAGLRSKRTVGTIAGILAAVLVVVLERLGYLAP